MKSICKLLSVVLIFLLFAACADDKLQEPDNPQPPVSGSNNIEATLNDNVSNDNKDLQDGNIENGVLTPAYSVPVDPAPIVDIICDFDTLTLTKRTIMSGFGTNAQGISERKQVENEIQYTYYYDLDSVSFVDEMYKLLKQTDDAFNPVPISNSPNYTACFYQRNGSLEESIEFSEPTGGLGYGSGRIWVRISDNERRALTKEATEKIIELCNVKGLKDGEFFAAHNYNTLLDWACSLSNRAPMLIYDEKRELSAEQAAGKMLYKLGEELTQPNINRSFYYENYTGWNFELYSNKTEDDSVRTSEHYKVWTLTDDQYIVRWQDICGDFVGVSGEDFGGPVEYYFLEFEAGIWRLWLRERP